MNEDPSAPTPAQVQAAIDSFHELYYASLGWDHYTYLGYQIKQCPLDLQLYQELAFRRRPGFNGSSAWARTSWWRTPASTGIRSIRLSGPARASRRARSCRKRRAS